MAGCRALTDTEISEFKLRLKCQRDKTLFVVGNRTGWRISQLLSIRLKHFIQHGKISKVIRIEKQSVKGQKQCQESPLHPEAIQEIDKLLTEQYGPNYSNMSGELPLFKSRNGQNKPLKRVQAHNILKEIVKELELEGKVATHSMRKTLGKKVYKASGNDLLIVQRALNHSSIVSTVRYLDINQEEVNELLTNLV